MNTRFVLTTGLFVAMIATGFIVSRGSRPYNNLWFTVHKLISLGTLVYLGIQVNRLDKSVALSVPVILCVIISAVLFIALFATGGMLSGMKDPAEILKKFHHILPYGLTVSSLTGIYLIGG